MAVEQNHYFKIDANGNWFHNGGPINRAGLVKLFADKGLKVDEQGEYWMQSPYEKYPVDVEDVPFVIVDFEELDGAVNFITNLDEHIEVGANHPIELRHNQLHDTKLPYIEVRDGLHARLGRNVFYALVERFGASLTSRGHEYALGELDDA